MDNTEFSKVVSLNPEDNKRLLNLCGKYDEHIHLIESYLNVDIRQRGYTFSVSGPPKAVEKACTILMDLYHEAKQHSILIPHQVHMYLQTDHSTKQTQTTHRLDIRTKRGLIKARGENQIRYLNNILQHDINFAIGPAGTGKTYFAVACAVNALEAERVSRIIITRPIVEAGEKLGFLPGDLTEKVDPYLRPLYDALYEMLGFDTVAQYIERGIIEIAPLAYMRGRSLNDSFIILDEGQNTTVSQMKMFLTRIGFNSKAVITGDITQIDLEAFRESGLIHAFTILKGIKGISFTEFQTSDVIRHALVKHIVEAYEAHEKKSG